MSEEQNIDQPADDRPRPTENENISEPSPINYQPSTNMEVHHPHQVQHKKTWKEYLLEYIMIVLAVTTGFFAESYREHLSDSSKEKKYVLNIKKDLIKDTINLNIWIPALQDRTENFDSLIFILENPEIITRGSEMYFYARLATRTRTFEASNNTLLELKNSGNLRLIRNQKVVNSLSDYQKIVDNYLNLNSVEIKETELVYPLIGNLFEASIFDKMLNTGTYTDVSEYDFASGSKSNLQKPPGNPQLRNNNNDMINLLIYYLHQRKSSFFSEIRLLKKEKKEAISLITLLNNEYYLEINK